MTSKHARRSTPKHSIFYRTRGPKAGSHIITRTDLLAQVLGITNPTDTERAAVQAMTQMWAPSTWAAKTGRWADLAGYCTARQVEVTPIQAVCFLDQLTVSIQAKHSYAKTLRSIFTRLQMTTVPLDFYSASLRAQGALVPLKQAPGITKAQLLEVMHGIPEQDQIALLIAWKTASRWEETAALHKEMFVVTTPEVVVINWGRATKGSRQDPFRESMFAAIVGPDTPRIACYVQKMDTNNPLSNLSGQALIKLMKTRLGSTYTTHSIKHGAVCQLLRNAAEGNVDLVAVMRLAKHKNLETTIRYGLSDPRAVALSLRTQEATRLL